MELYVTYLIFLQYPNIVRNEIVRRLQTFVSDNMQVSNIILSNACLTTNIMLNKHHLMIMRLSHCTTAPF